MSDAHPANEPVTALVHPAIAGVIEALPHPSNHWPVIEQEKWLCAMRAVLELVYTYPAPPADPAPSSLEPGDRPHE